MNPPIDDLGIIVAAGGSGSRYGQDNKLLLTLGGMPVFVHSIRAFHRLCRPGALSLVCPAGEVAAFRAGLERFLPEADVRIVTGGQTRTESVRKGLESMPDFVRYVAIHDAARPLASAKMLLDCLELARCHDGAVVGRPVADTLKRADADGCVAGTVDRAFLWAVETPQIMNLALLIEAYERAGASAFTDDAGVMEHAGRKVALSHAHNANLKLTYPGDLPLLERMLNPVPYTACPHNPDN